MYLINSLICPISSFVTGRTQALLYVKLLEIKRINKNKSLTLGLLPNANPRRAGGCLMVEDRINGVF